MSSINKDKFSFVSEREKEHDEARPSLTYWQDAFRRLRKHKLAMIGLCAVILIVLFGLLGPVFTPYSYSDQNNNHKNLPPRLKLYELESSTFFYISGDYSMFHVADDGSLTRLKEVKTEEEVANQAKSRQTRYCLHPR